MRLGKRARAANDDFAGRTGRTHACLPNTAEFTPAHLISRLAAAAAFCKARVRQHGTSRKLGRESVRPSSFVWNSRRKKAGGGWRALPLTRGGVCDSSEVSAVGEPGLASS